VGLPSSVGEQWKELEGMGGSPRRDILTTFQNPQETRLESNLEARNGCA